MKALRVLNLNELKSKSFELSKEEEADLIVQVQKEHNQESAEKILLSQFKNIYWIANKYSKINPNININDLIQEGIIGLLKSIKNFDIEKNIRLSTYSQPWIKHEIINYIIKNFHIINPIKTKEQRKIFFNLKRELNLIEDKKLSNEQENKLIANKLKVSQDEVLEVRNMVENNYQDIETISDNIYEENLLDEIETEERRKILGEVVDTLEHEEKIIIYERFIMEPKRTREEIAKELGISSEAVRKRENKIIEKMRKKIINRIY